MTLKEIRDFIGSLEGVSEAPHHHLISFRINSKNSSKIFATMPQDGSFLNIFVDEATREKMLGMYPDAYEKVWWGKKVMGVKAFPDKAQQEDLENLLRSAWQYKSK